MKSKQVGKTKRSSKKRMKLTGDDRIIDLLERLSALILYLQGEVDQNTIARKLGMDTTRTNEILKGVKKKK